MYSSTRSATAHLAHRPSSPSSTSTVTASPRRAPSSSASLTDRTSPPDGNSSGRAWRVHHAAQRAPRRQRRRRRRVREPVPNRRRAGTARNGSASMTPGRRPRSSSAPAEVGSTNVTMTSYRCATLNCGVHHRVDGVAARSYRRRAATRRARCRRRRQRDARRVPLQGAEDDPGRLRQQALRVRRAPPSSR